MQVSLFADIDYRILILLTQARDAMHEARQAELTKHGISAIEALALFVIDDAGNAATPAEISRRTMRRHNTVTALLGRMEKKGLITKAKDPERKNVWRIRLTREGENACHKAMELESIRTALTGLSAADKQRLESYLRSIRKKAPRRVADDRSFAVP